ncbi:MAG: hypothetical protein AB7Q37_14785 [Pyrinomonadaceae bacterium]
MISESSVTLYQNTKRPFRFERFYSPTTGKKMWQASCQFEVKIELANDLDDLEKNAIEYRQFIRGGVWVRRGNQDWTDDSNPNGNPHFKIPPYKGQTKVNGIPKAAVSGTGLSLSWKEDGEVEAGGTERFGYRTTADITTTNEVDLWTNPNQITGRTYKLLDTPSIAGEWGSGDSVELWIELYFKGFVVEVETTDTDVSRPIRILKQKSWSYFWPDKKLKLWMDATAI